MSISAIYNVGIHQGDLVDLIALVKTNFNAILTKLDADAGVTDTDYNSTLAVSIPAGINTTGAKGILSQGDVETFLNSFITNWNLFLAKADADLGDTDYAATLAITDVVGLSTDSIQSAGFHQGPLVYVLNQIVTKINAVNAKLDADGGVTDTNFAALWNITDEVIEGSALSRVI
jgi:hypothetical protein